MKKLVVLVMAITLVFAVSCSKKEQEKTAEVKKGGVVELLPENTEFMLKFGSFETVRKQTSTSDATAFGRPIERLEEIKAKLGFNPFNVEELKAHGFDPGKEFGVAVADIIVEEKNDKPNFNGLVFLPVNDGKKAIETIKTAIQKQFPGTKVTQEGDLTVLEEATVSNKFYLAVKNAYLFVAVNPKVDTKPFMEAVLTGKSSLTKAKTYTDVMGKIGSDKEIVAYVNIAKVAEKNLNTLKNLSRQSAGAKSAPEISASLNYLSDYESIGLSLDLANPNLSVKSVVNMVAGSKSLKMWEGLQANKNAVLGVPEHPVLLFSVLLNAPEYYKMMTEAMSEDAAKNLKTRLEGIKTAFGIELETEVINNLAGNLNLGIYDGGSITIGNFNTLFTVSVKDEAVMKSVLEKVLAKLPPGQKAMVSKQPVGGVDAYVVMAGPVQLYIGVKAKNLIIAAGKPMFEKALKGDVAAGFVAKVEDKELAGKLKGDESTLYLNAAETLKVVKNFQMFIPGGGKGLDQKTQDAVGKFEYILASSKLDGNSILGDFTIKTKFTEPFFIEVEKLSKSFEPQPK